MKLGILLLAGGLSSRMHHKDKAMLTMMGKTFIEILGESLKDFEYKYLSINAHQDYSLTGFVPIVDEIQEIGPLGGIVSAFHQSGVDALFVCSCDMPLIQKEFVDFLASQLENYDGIFVEDTEHIYPTAGIYTRKMLPVIEEMIASKNYRLYQCIKRCSCKIVKIEDSSMLQNINTEEEYQKFIENLGK